MVFHKQNHKRLWFSGGACVTWWKQFQESSTWCGTPEGNLVKNLVAPSDRLNAIVILSLLQPLDRYRATCAIGSAIGRALSSKSRIHAKVGVLNRLVLKPLRGLKPRDSGAIVSQTPLKQARHENAIETAILNRVLDRDWTPQPQGATKVKNRWR